MTTHEAPVTIIEADRASVEYRTMGRTVRAMIEVSLAIEQGESVGVIGESGSGKSTLIRTLLGLVRPSTGTVTYRDQDIYALPSRQRHRFLGSEVSLVFQDPRSSLNPRWSVNAVVADPLQVQGGKQRHQVRDRVSELLEQVGLSNSIGTRPVRSLSGGQAQRVAMARALALGPSLLAADEPTSALDVAVQAQVLNLLKELRTQHHFALMVVSHDIRVIRFLTERTAVMRHGEIVELGPTEQIHSDPQHPYTKELLAAAPSLQSAMGRLG